MNTATSSYLNREEVRAQTVTQFLSAAVYQIICEPARGEFYSPETSWPEMSNQRMVHNRLRQCDDAAFVIFRGHLPPKDVSDAFAFAWALDLAESGHDYNAIASVKFISRHLVDSDILALTKGK